MLTSQFVLALDYKTNTSIDVQWATNTPELDSQSAQALIKHKVTTEFKNGNKLTAIGQFFVETIDGLEPGDIDQKSYSAMSRPAIWGGTSELALGELFLEIDKGRHYFTLGKQQVVWGKADGLKVLDVVNPQSYREFILADFEDSRLPLWMVNYEWQINNDSSLQFLWVPDQSVHALPNRNATYAFSSPRLVPVAPAGIEVELGELERPARIVADADIGLRWSAFMQGWDLTLNYLYRYDDFPVFYRRLTDSPSGPKVFIEPGYERTHLLGGTFTNSFGDLTLRGELGYASERFFITSDVADADGVVKSSEFSYVLGFDWFGFNDTLMSLQLFQSIILDPAPGITRPTTDTTLTLLLRKEFLNDTFKADILVLHNLNDHDGLLRPKITYEWRDNLKVWLGADIFRGDKEGLFGQFDHNDRIVSGFEYVF